MRTFSRFPLLTSITLGLSAALTATRLLGNGPLQALRRDPTALGHGQLWRLLSPVLVQSDASVINVVLVFALCAAIGAFAEQRFSRGRWLALYLAGALTGHAIGEAFQPRQGGTSVAFVGILGGLAAYSLLGRDPQLRKFRVQAAVTIPLAILDTALGDIHGVPYLVGLALGALWVRHDEAPAQPVPGHPEASSASTSFPVFSPRNSRSRTSGNRSTSP